MIGKCSSCFMVVDGVPNSKACRIPVREGMRVERQRGWGNLDLNTQTKSIRDIAEEKIETDLLIIGGGPAGLAAAVEAAQHGLEVVLVDEHFKLGGQLLKQTHKFFGSVELMGGLRGFQIAEEYAKRVLSMPNIKVLTESVAYGVFRGGLIGIAGGGTSYVVKPRAVIVATGAFEKYLEFPNNDLPGVIGAGGAQTIMNEFGVKPGEAAIVIGSGNVGLIISYQLLQAGVKVKAVVEIMGEIGGWFVHAAKLKRYGVPILLRHTLKHVLGDERVREAVVVAVDDNYDQVPGSEKRFDVDLVLLAIGLEPDTRLFTQSGAVMKYSPELGGIVPLRTIDLETSVPNMYVAGDASGVEEATAAMIEGRIAALSIVSKLGDTLKQDIVEREMNKFIEFLWKEYRASPLLERALKGKKSVTVTKEEMYELRRTNPSPISFG